MTIYRACLKWTGTLLLLTLGILSGTHPVKAIESQMDYWFNESFSVSNMELPVGIVVRSSDPDSQTRRFLILENQSDILLFVLSLNYKDVLVMETPDPNWKARVIGAHEVASYLVAPTRPAYLNMEALTDLDHSLVDQNGLSFEPPPTDAAIPALQNSELLLVYGEQVFQVPFTVSYSLNAQFDNGTQSYVPRLANTQAADQPSATPTQQADVPAARVTWNNIMLIGLVSTAVLLIAGWLVWRRLSRTR
jgi:hypothetical protein